MVPYEKGSFDKRSLKDNYLDYAVGDLSGNINISKESVCSMF
jgi:hypothetical protein